MTNAREPRETLALRNELHVYLTPAELRDTHWPTVLTAAEPALARGWTGHELARWCIAELGHDVASAAAVMVSTLRRLGQTDPPRQTTPTPVAMSDLRAEAERARAEAAHVDHAAHAAAVKDAASRT